MEVNNSIAASEPPSSSSSSSSLTPNNHSYKHHDFNSQTHKHHHHHLHFPSNTIFITIISLTSAMVLLAIFVVIYMLRLKSNKKKNVTSKEDNIIINTSNRFIAPTTLPNFNSSPEIKGGCLYGGNFSKVPPSKLRGVQVFTYRELQVATDNFSEANIMRNGGIAAVYKGVLSDGTIAAIKMLRRDDKQGERAFRLEVDLLSRLHSPYLVELLGYCADQHHRLLVYEFMPNGTLQNHLHPSGNQIRPLDWGTRLRIALDCARALEFLHEYAIPPVIHHDFKCTNVLLDQNLRAKVSDFGLAKMCSGKINGQISTRVLGTTGYLAPEYASTGKLTTKSDAYSFGVVLLELLTGRVPVDKKRPPGEHVLVTWALPGLTNRDKVIEMVDPTLQGQYPKKDLIQVAAIAAMCVQPEADYRPLMTDVAQSLIPLIKNPSSISSSSSLRFLNQTANPNHQLH